MKNLTKILCFILIMSTVLTIMAGCGNVVYVTGIEMKNKSKTVLVNDAEVLVANVLPHNASNSKIEWTSSDETILTVNSGVLTPLQIGIVTVTATTKEGGYSKTVEVEIVANQFEVSKNFNKDTKGYGITKFSRINDAVATADGNDTIVVKEGVYNEIVPITKPLKLVGNRATIKGYFMVGYPRLEKYVEGVTIDGFNFICEEKTSFDEPACIYLGNEVSDITIRNCKFSGVSKDSLGIRNIEGAEIGAVMNPKITLCEFENLKNAINFCQYVTKAEVFNNSFTNCQFGLFLQGSKQSKIVGNKFIDSGLICVEKANTPTSQLILKQNEIIRDSKTSEANWREIIRVREGDIKSNEKIDLRGNIFYGVKIENLTNLQLQKFKSTIDVSSPSGNILDFSKFIFR